MTRNLSIVSGEKTITYTGKCTVRSAPFLFPSRCLRPHNQLDFELQQLRRQVRKLSRCVGLLQISSPQDLRCDRVFRVPHVTCEDFSADVDALYSCRCKFCVTTCRSKMFALAVPVLLVLPDGERPCTLIPYFII